MILYYTIDLPHLPSEHLTKKETMRSELPLPDKIFAKIFSELNINDLFEISSVSFYFREISLTIANEKLNDIISKIISLQLPCEDRIIFLRYFKNIRSMFTIKKGNFVKINDGNINPLTDFFKLPEKVLFIKMISDNKKYDAKYKEILALNNELPEPNLQSKVMLEICFPNAFLKSI